ncbi:MAG TPA: hypothetical protein VK066_27200 [Chloroflexota bacterium]|nr:hypothetical protein [Chloroflexota bacterium]
MWSRSLPKAPARPGLARHPRVWRPGVVFVLLAALLGPLLLTQPAARADVPEALTDQATLEMRLPVVQWSEAGAPDWQTVDDRATVHAGDRVRTGPDAGARLIYFEGTVIEIAPSTGLVVEQLETSPSGGLVTRLLQTAGVTVSRVVHLVDPSASFEVETPAAVVFVRGTTPRVEVDPDNTTHVRNVPDGTDSRVGVRGKDPAQTEVILLQGQETDVAPGQPPTPPRASNPGPTPVPTAQTATLPALPPTTPPPVLSGNPCQQPGVVCEPFPTVDPCRVRPSDCAPGGPPTTVPLPSATPRPAPAPPTATPRAPTPAPTLSTNPCQRSSIVCDPQPPVNPCRLRASGCGPTGPATAVPQPTRVQPPPIGDTGGGRPRPTLVVAPPSGDTGGSRGHPTPVSAQPPIGEVGGGRTFPSLPQLPIGEIGGSRGHPTAVPPPSGPIIR